MYDSRSAPNFSTPQLLNSLNFQTSQLPNSPKNGHVLENVVYLELLRRYDTVFIGVLPKSEVDFVAIQNGTPTYFQVALSVRDETTLARELNPLKSIRDQYPKFLLTLDNDPPFDHNGIRRLSVVNFLLNAEGIT